MVTRVNDICHCLYRATPPPVRVERENVTGIGRSVLFLRLAPRRRWRKNPPSRRPASAGVRCILRRGNCFERTLRSRQFRDEILAREGFLCVLGNYCALIAWGRFVGNCCFDFGCLGGFFWAWLCGTVNGWFSAEGFFGSCGSILIYVWLEFRCFGTLRGCT